MSPHHLSRLPLVLLAALLAGCAGGEDKGGALKRTGSVDAQGTGAQQTVSIAMTDDLTFVPNVVRAKVGSLALTAKNEGRVPHNLVFADRDKGALPTVKGHGTGTLTIAFPSTGTYRFTCTFHSGMDGEVVVSG